MSGWQRLWTDEKRKNAQELICSLLAVKTGPGWAYVPKTIIALRELTSSSSHVNLTHSTVMKLLDKMYQRGEQTVDSFEAHFRDFLKERNRELQKKSGPWSFYLPLEISIHHDLKLPFTLTILNRQFSFIPRTSVQVGNGVLDSPKNSLKILGFLINDIPDVFLKISSTGHSWEEAWQVVAPAFDALRGLMEFSFGFGRARSFSSEPTPRRQIPHPQWMIALKRRNKPEGLRFVADDHGTQTPFVLNVSRLTTLRNSSKVLRAQPVRNSIISVIADGLRLYSQAMDARFSYGCFLGLWQMAEALTLSETVGGQTDKVVERIAWHGSKLGLYGSGWTETMKVLAKKRMDIVHRGIHEIEDEEVNIFKHVCEISLLWLIKQTKTLPTVAHLQHFYRLREINSTDLQAMRDCIQLISAQRAEK